MAAGILEQGQRSPGTVEDQAGEIMRYYYLFTYPEIECQLKSAGFKVLRAYAESGYKKTLKYFSRNICVLVKAD